MKISARDLRAHQDGLSIADGNRMRFAHKKTGGGGEGEEGRLKTEKYDRTASASNLISLIAAQRKAANKSARSALRKATLR